MAGHARLGPSGAARWTVCTASPMESDGLPDEESQFARWGTAAHLVASKCLELNCDPAGYLGNKVVLPPDADEFIAYAEAEYPFPSVPIDDEMVECCRSYIKLVTDLVESTGGTLLVEQRVPIDHLTGEEGAGGTADTVILVPHQREIIIGDLKGGQGVEVSASYVVGIDSDNKEIRVPNKQLAMYAGGVLREYAIYGDFDTVRMFISQPRLNHVSEFAMSVADLNDFLQREVVAKAEETRTNPRYVPSHETCVKGFCKARKTCKARDRHILESAVVGFEDMSTATMREVPLPELGLIYDRLEDIEAWCKDKRELAREELEAGRPVIGAKGPYKLVEGRMGNRAWKDEAKVEEIVRDQFRLKKDDAYNFTFKSPAQLEKVLAKDHPKQWKKLQEFIKQDRTKPVIAPATSPKPAVATATSGFTDVPSTPAANDDQAFAALFGL